MSGSSEGNPMTLGQALKVVERRYGLGKPPYLDERTGKMLYVVRAERELKAMPEVKLPEEGIALLAYEVRDLAEGNTSVAALVRKKHPELFIQEVIDEINSNEEGIDPAEQESLLNELGAMSFGELQKAQAHFKSELEQNFRLAVISKLKLKILKRLVEDSLRDC